MGPVEAVARFENTSVSLGDIPIDDLKIDVIPSGFPTLDGYMLLKRNRCELIILGARPSHGKSALVCQIAEKVAENTGVMLFSLEMDKTSIKARHLSAVTGIPLPEIQKGLSDTDMQRLIEANKRFQTLQYFIDDRPKLDVMEIASSVRSRNKTNKIGLIIVDYLQLVQVKARNNRHEELGDVTGTLKALAKEIGCPVIALSQLSRACEQRGNDQRGNRDYRPQLSDLRDSGSLEQDADIVIALSRENVYNHNKGLNEADIGILKNKNGKSGWDKYRFFGAQTKFVDHRSYDDPAPKAAKPKPIIDEEPF